MYTAVALQLKLGICMLQEILLTQVVMPQHLTLVLTIFTTCILCVK